MKPDLFSHLFDLQDARLNTLGDPLEEMSRMVDWEAFRPRLKRVHAKRNESNKGNARLNTLNMKNLCKKAY